MTKNTLILGDQNLVPTVSNILSFEGFEVEAPTLEEFNPVDATSGYLDPALGFDVLVNCITPTQTGDIHSTTGKALLDSFKKDLFAYFVTIQKLLAVAPNMTIVNLTPGTTYRVSGDLTSDMFTFAAESFTRSLAHKGVDAYHLKYECSEEYVGVMLAQILAKPVHTDTGVSIYDPGDIIAVAQVGDEINISVTS